MSNELGFKNIAEAEEELNSVKAEIDLNINKSENLLNEADHIAEKIIVQEAMLQNRVIKDDQIDYVIRSLQSSCIGLNISIESLQVSPYLSMEKTPNRNLSVAHIALEEGISLFEKILNTIKDLFTWIWNNLKVFFTKLVNSTDAMIRNITDLITYIEQSSKTKVFKTLTREQFKGLVSRSPIIFILGNDPSLIKKALSSSVHLDISTEILKDIETYGQAMMNDPNVDILVFTHEINKAVDQILQTQSNHIYNNLVNKIGELNELSRKGRVTIYRADGRKIKYRYITQAKDISGVKTLNIQNRSYTLSRKDEDLISINKVFRPDEISTLLRNVASYLSSVNTTQNAIRDKINRAQNLTKQIEAFAKQNSLKTGVYLLAFNNYYKLLKLLLTSIATETILSNYETAKNIYFACNKYVKVALDVTTISKESFTEHTENEHLILDYNKLPEVLEVQIDEDGMNEELLEDSAAISQEGWYKTFEGIRTKIRDYTVNIFEWEETKSMGKSFMLINWITRWVLTYYRIKKDPGDAGKGIIRKMQGEIDDFEQINKLYMRIQEHENYIASKNRNLRTYAEYGSPFYSNLKNTKSILRDFKKMGQIKTLNGVPLTTEEKQILTKYISTYSPLMDYAEKVIKKYVENYDSLTPYEY